jgi:Tol biopolymer transport system component
MHLGALGLVAAAALLGANAAATKTKAGAAPFDLPKPAGQVAFVNDGQGDSLDVIHADYADFGSEVMQVSPPGTPVFAYAWSPVDGRPTRIAYIDGNDGSLWLVGPGGYGRRRLLAGSTPAGSDLRDTGSELSWSRDGRKIAVTSYGPHAKASFDSCAGLHIYVVPFNGAQPRKLQGADSSCDGIAWSPRGNQIAYGDGGIWVIHPDGSGRRRISRRGWGWVDWSADGKQVAFGVSVKVNHGLGLYRGIGVVNADGRHFHVVTRNADNEYPAVWSPKGHRLLYGRVNDGGIYVIGANGRNDRRVTTDPPHGSEWPALAWSPDGRSIVYANSTGGLVELGLDGRGKVQLTNPGSGDLDPSWILPTNWDWG